MHKKLPALLSFILLAAFQYVAVCQTSDYVMKTIGNHEDEVLGVYVNWNNTMFASCSVDETIKLWSLPDCKLISTLEGHIGEVNNISISGNDQWLASGSTDETVKIWDITTAKEMKTLYGHSDQVIGVYFNSDSINPRVASTSFDKTVKLWDVNLGSEIKTLYGHKESINNVAYSYDGKFIASCSDDKTVKIWSTDLTTKIPLLNLEGHEAPVLTCIFSFDSKYLASSDQIGEIIIWLMPEGRLIRKVRAHKDLIQDLSFAEDNKTLVSGSLDGVVKLWNVETGENLMNFETGVEVWSVDLVSDASIITLGCSDGTVRILTNKEPSKADKKVKKGGKK
ncbi:MAG: repeat protein [Ignavibacteria bacterium]|nr:repeat protein [Ignavibacteria bacterium]